MEREQAKMIVRKISAVYPSFKMDDPTFVIDTWYGILKDFDFASVDDNLNRYTLESEYPPKIKDLVKGLVVNEKYNIPGIEETKKIVAGYQVPKDERMPQEEVKALVKKITSEIRGLKND